MSLRQAPGWNTLSGGPPYGQNLPYNAQNFDPVNNCLYLSQGGTITRGNVNKSISGW